MIDFRQNKKAFIKLCDKKLQDYNRHHLKKVVKWWEEDFQREYDEHVLYSDPLSLPQQQTKKFNIEYFIDRTEHLML